MVNHYLWHDHAMIRTEASVTFVIILLLTVVELQGVNLVKANFLAMPAHSTINVFSPENAKYYNSSLTLNFSVVEDHAGNSVRYSLDGGDFETVTHFRIVSQEPITVESFGKRYNLTQYTIMCDKVLNNLSDGNHSLTVYNGYVDSLYGHFYENAEVTVWLNIDTSTPEIKNLSIRNATYTINDIQMNFTVSKPVSWIGYTLDNHANVTISCCNTTITGLPEGSHTLVVYANDTVGKMGVSETISFAVARPQIETFGKTITVAVLAVPIAIVCIGIGLLVYRKKHRH
jgi:hypothetical protein